MTIDEIKLLVTKSVKKLRDENPHLFVVDINERSIMHKFAEILQKIIGDRWDVDCEYNRNGHDAKYLDLSVDHIRSDDLTSCTVYPDIIIHKRDTSNNLLVIELKKSTNKQPRSKDYRKLSAYRSQLGYEYAVFIQFEMSSDRTLDLIQYNEEWAKNCDA